MLGLLNSYKSTRATTRASDGYCGGCQAGLTMVKAESRRSIILDVLHSRGRIFKGQISQVHALVAHTEACAQMGKCDAVLQTCQLIKQNVEKELRSEDKQLAIALNLSLMFR